MTTSKRDGGLGFKDLHKFNQALLANQAWKIINRHHCLLHRVLKSHYFRDGSLLNENCGTQPSYGWQSLLFGCELLKFRSYIDIGNGISTKMSIDRWLPITPPRPPILRPNVDPTIFVSDLIDPLTLQWDDIKLTEKIEQHDHHLIKKIYLPFVPTLDKLTWKYTIDENYSVKTGYRLIMKNLPTDEINHAPLAENMNIAKDIRSSNLAPKIQHFLCRLASKILAVNENLRKRRMNVDRFCARCCTYSETTYHVFFTCPYAKEVWRMSGIPSQLLFNRQALIEDKLRMLFAVHKNHSIPEHKRYLPFWILWLWKCRNDIRFNNKTITVNELLEFASSDVKEWMDSQVDQQITSNPLLRNQQGQVRWKNLNDGWVKCNYDASHHEGNITSGLSWIIRNNNGQLLECGMGKFQGRFTPEESECTTLIWALQTSWSLGYRKVEFEGDNLTINHIINSKGNNPKLQHCIEYIKKWSSMFDMIKFSFKNRMANACADLLARKAILDLIHLNGRCLIFALIFSICL